MTKFQACEDPCTSNYAFVLKVKELESLLITNKVF